MTKIREIRSADIETILRIRLDWLSKKFDVAEITDLARAWFARYPGNEMAPALVAEVDGQIVGYLLCGLTKHPASIGTKAEIDEVCVADKYRRQGLGSRLVNELRQRLLSTIDDL